MILRITGTFATPVRSEKEALYRLSVRLKQMADGIEPERTKDEWEGTIEVEAP